MKNLTTRERKASNPFSLSLFFLTITTTLAVFFVPLAIYLPSFWQRQISFPIWKYAIVFLCAHFLACFVEFFFHRYFLHSCKFRFLKRFYTQHTLHHALTSVRAVSRDGEACIESKYPIVTEKQYEASFFPWFSLGAFLLLSLPLVILGQWMFLGWPIVLGSVAAVTWSLILYELVHSTEHLPYESFWASRVTSLRWGKFWRSLYSFHIHHHAHIGTNEAVGGFFGIPMADIVFGTHVSSSTPLVDGMSVKCAAIIAPRPIGIIRFLDHHFGFKKK